MSVELGRGRENRGLSHEHRLAVDKAAGRELHAPLGVVDLEYLDLRPVWNVPTGIARAYASPVLLPDGNVLLMNGENDQGPRLKR